MIVVAAGFHFIAASFDKPLTVMIAEKDASLDADFEKDLKIVSRLSLRERRTRNLLQILCKIKNNGKVAWRGIEVQAELFSKGQYVDECNQFVKNLMPGEEDNLKIICGECGVDTIPEYDEIKLKVAGAHRD
jgi:hypothetical protein